MFLAYVNISISFFSIFFSGVALLCCKYFVNYKKADVYAAQNVLYWEYKEIIALIRGGF